MNYTNEEIARAAGLGEYIWNRDYDYEVPKWPDDPGAVATWLLPVLEKRWPAHSLCRNPHLKDEFMWSFQNYESKVDGNELWAPTWHECLIEAIMATAEGGK